MQLFRWILLLVVACVPLTTLVFRDDLGRWQHNHSAMAAPDEFSYLLLADNVMHGAGISTQATIGRDTFYPPGYPLLLAGVGECIGLNLFHAHVLNAALLSLGTIIVFLLARRLLAALADPERPRFQFSRAATEWIAVAIAALFATNWHVLEGALYVFSEPAFMLVTFAWLALGLRWREWHRHLGQTILLALLALAAWSIRGAGIVCVGTMLLVPLVQISKRAWLKPAMAILAVLLMAGLYQAAITWASPEKSLAAGSNTDNSYLHQLTHGLTKNGTIHPGDPHDWAAFAGRVGDLLFSHLDDYASSFIPWFREAPDYLFLNVIGKTVGLLGLLGWLHRLLRRRSATRFLEMYVLLYMALYLVWPFNMARFWAPLLPIMLVYAVDALRQFSWWGVRIPVHAVAILLLALLLGLHGEELTHQLGNYERRLNYVSDALAAAAATVVRLSPDPAKTIIVIAGSDEHFLYAWYLPHGREGTWGGAGRYLPESPSPHIAGPGSRRQTLEELLLQALQDTEQDPQKHLFVIGYFQEPSYPQTFSSLQKTAPALLARFRWRKVFQKEILVTVWEFSPQISVPASDATNWPSPIIRAIK
jgi:hypothetical protein